MTEEKPKRIAIVDDNWDTLRLSQALLSGRGYEIVTFQDGQKFLDAHPETFDLAIVDLMMPGTSGAEVIRQVHEKVRCIVVTGTDTRTRANAFVVGAIAVLQKPLEKSALADIVREVLG